jgi:hypothetical protein
MDRSVYGCGWYPDAGVFEVQESVERGVRSDKFTCSLFDMQTGEILPCLI